MDLQKELAKHMKQLNKAIRRLVAKSRDFEELRHFLRDQQMELAIYVVPLIGGKPAGQELRFELTEEDRRFLKKAGIRF